MARNGGQPAAGLLLTLIAAVVLFAAACGASEAKNGGEAPDDAAPREGSGGPSGETTSLPEGPPDITGTITEVERGKPGTDPTGRILVEEDPGVAKAGKKLYLEIGDETRVFVRRGGGRGDARPAAAGELARGQTVDAWHTGHPILESYPGQTVASEVVISPSPPPRSAVFLPVQTSLSADMMTSRIRGRLTLDGRGCLHVENPKYRTDSVPVWPAGFEVDTAGGEVRVLRDNGKIFGRAGEWVVLGGGEISVGALRGNRLVEGPVLDELLERCPGDYWLAA